MPYKSYKRKASSSYGGRKRYRTTYRKVGRKVRKFNRKKNVRGFRNVLTRARWPGLTLPAKVMKKFEYEDTQSVDTTAFNTSKTQHYVTNDIYDPDYTHVGTDHTVQNYGVFINQNMYRQWKVFGCKINVTFINLGGAMAMVVPLLVSAAALPAAGDTYEQVNALTATSQAAAPVFIGPLTGGNNIQRRKYYCAPWVALGLSRMQYSSDLQCNGAYGARPTKRSFISFVTIGVGSQAIIEIRVSFTYYCQMFDLAMGADTAVPAPEP